MTVLEVSGLSVKRGGFAVLQNISFSLDAGNSMAILGSGGSGKTTLVEALSGRLFHKGEVRFSKADGSKPVVAVVARQHQFKTLSNTTDFYYQQRFNAFDAEDSRTISQELLDRGADKLSIAAVLKPLGMEQLAETPLIQLSNGEHKKFQIAEAVLQNADWLILDEPYIGLDKASRTSLNLILDGLSEKGMHFILATSHMELPSSVTIVGILANHRLDSIKPRNQCQFDAADPILDKPEERQILASLLTEIPSAYPHQDFKVAVKMVGVNITYGKREVLRDIHWEIQRGECWSLTGPNGSGKSTLLSLINADNPQAFANEIWLFDRKKGSGESIWDIKRKIGYVSPELHHYLNAGNNCLEIVASGLFDTMGLFRKLTNVQQGLAQTWMDVLALTHLSGTYFRQLSDSAQRQVLLARALVKNPPLLILDEPCQGLDERETAQFVHLVDLICTTLKKTLVYVSHYDSEMPACINRFMRLRDGRIDPSIS